MYKILKKIKTNNINTITYYQHNKRFVKTFSMLSEDIDQCRRKIFSLIKKKEAVRIFGLIGPISYDWIVIDLACIKSGIKTIAIPEHLSQSAVQEILTENECSLILIDFSLNQKYDFENISTYYFNCEKDNIFNNFNTIEESLIDNEKINILEEYSITYSSGTSKNLKKITCHFSSKDLEDGNPQLQVKKKFKRLFIKNKIIIYMPFSHWQQRLFFYSALDKEINIVLSDSQNCIRHLILEKPNIMISVPAIYETLASRIEKKLKNMSVLKKRTHYIFNKLGINTWSSKNLFKIIISNLIYSDIKKIYGGRTCFFISGSAPLSIKTLKTFYSIGIRIIEAYGQSESDTISINNHKIFKLGSVGKPLVDIVINKDSEVLIKYDEKRHKKNKKVLKIDDQGYIHTGDIGFLDKEGFLFLKGRIDDVIVLDNGEKIFPEEIEKQLKESDEIKEALVFLNNNIISVILWSNYSAKNKLITIMNRVNNQLPEYQRIKKYRIVWDPLTLENGLLTPSLKLMRKEAINRYGKECINIQNEE